MGVISAGVKPAKKHKKILFVTSEAVPFVKSGGLADVCGALPKALARRGHDVRVVLPRHWGVNRDKFKLSPALAHMGVPMNGDTIWCGVLEGEVGGVKHYFVEHEGYFGRAGLYDDGKWEYQDNAERFGFFSRACIQLCKDIDFQPDIIHCNDWHTALVPPYLKIREKDNPYFGRTASVFTIHNLGHQGVFPAAKYGFLDLGNENFTEPKFESWGKVHFLKGGIFYADAITTVSPTYAEEILMPPNGMGLTPYLERRKDDFFGILNGRGGVVLPAGQKEKALDALVQILAKSKNFELLYFILDNLIYESALTEDQIGELLRRMLKAGLDPALSEMVGEFFGRAIKKAIAVFQADVATLSQWMRSAGKTADPEDLYLRVRALNKQAQRVAGLIKFANGLAAKSGVTEQNVGAIFGQLLEEARVFLRELGNQLAQDAQKLAAPAVAGSDNGWAQMAAFFWKLNWAGLIESELSSTGSVISPAGAVSAFGMEIGAFCASYQAVKARHDQLYQGLQVRTEALQSRLIVSLPELPGVISRPVAGGKGSNYAELVTALKWIADQGLVDPSVKVMAPRGFVITPLAHQEWNGAGRPDQLSAELEVDLLLSYRSLIVEQMRDLLVLIAHDFATDDAVKKELATIFNESFITIFSTQSTGESLDAMLDVISGYV
ncbi:MAG: glycogen/starch synthase, partial [Candidatus Omnitrophota bacterium]